MRQLWHRIVGHNWKRSCRLCREVRWHGDSPHVLMDYCRCGARRVPDA